MGKMDDNDGNKRNERREKGAKQEHRCGAKGTVESLNMKIDLKNGSVWILCRRYRVFYCRKDSPLGSETD
jgi:hypothetical protein